MDIKPITLDIDFKNPNWISPPPIRHGDNIPLVLNITDDGEPVDLSAVTIASLATTRLDKEVIVLDGVVDGSTITFEMGGSECSLAGSVEATAQLYFADGRVSTANFPFVAVKDPTGEGYVPSEREDTLIQILMKDIPQTLEDTQQAITEAETATTSATTAADHAEQVAQENKTRFLNAVASVTDRNTQYPSPSHGDTVRVTSEAKTYRYVNGTGWVVTDQYDPTAVDALASQLVDTRQDFATQLADMVEDSKQRALNVRMPPFNVKGDGTDESVKIQSAIDYANTHGYEVYFPPAPIAYGAENLQMYRGTKLRGAGKWENGLKGFGNAPVIVTDSYPSHFSNKGIREVQIMDLKIQNEKHPCISMQWSPDYNIHNCWLLTTTSDALKIRFSVRGNVSLCKVTTGGVGATEEHFAISAIDNCNGATIVENVVAGGVSGSGIEIEQSQGMSIDNNTFEVCGGWGIRIAGGSKQGYGNVNGLSLRNNYFEQVRKPISIGRRSTVQGADVSSNFANNSALSLLDSAEYGIELGRCKGAKIEGNSFFGSPDSGEPFAVFLYTASGVNTFVNSSLKNNNVEGFLNYYKLGTETGVAYDEMIFGTSEIVFGSEYNLTHGQVKTYVTDKLNANSSFEVAFESARGNGGRILRVEVIEQSGTVDAKLSVGVGTNVNLNLNAFDLSTLTYVYGIAEVPLTNNRLVKNTPAILKIVPGVGNGSFRVRIIYKN